MAGFKSSKRELSGNLLPGMFFVLGFECTVAKWDRSQSSTSGVKYNLIYSLHPVCKRLLVGRKRLRNVEAWQEQGIIQASAGGICSIILLKTQGWDVYRQLCLWYDCYAFMTVLLEQNPEKWVWSMCLSRALSCANPSYWAIMQENLTERTSVQLAVYLKGKI